MVVFALVGYVEGVCVCVCVVRPEYKSATVCVECWRGGRGRNPTLTLDKNVQPWRAEQIETKVQIQFIFFSKKIPLVSQIQGISGAFRI